MAKYRQLYTEFWNDSFVLDLDPKEKYFYIYLLTNANTSQCGIYELPKKIIEMQTGYNRETVDKLLKKFEEYKKIIYSDETKEIIILNWVKYNEPNNINAIKCVNREIKKIKNRNFVKELYLQYSKIGLEVDKLFDEIKDNFTDMDQYNQWENSFENIDKYNKAENTFIKIDKNNETEGGFINKSNKTKDSYITIYENDEIEEASTAIDKNDEIEESSMAIDKNNKIKNSYKGITSGYEGAYKGLVSKEVISNKEEVISNSCCSNREEVIGNREEEVISNREKGSKYNNTTATTTAKPCEVKSCMDNFKNIKNILDVFESNIHKVVPMEQRKIIEWSNKFKSDVIIMAIEESIGNDIKNIRYIEKILNTWFSKGLTSPEDIEAYKKQWSEKKKRLNSKEISVDHWDYDGQRVYDFEDLERKLLS